MAIIKVITPSVTDANITTAKVTDNAITLAKMASGTDGNIISYDASGNPVAIATGSDGQVLTSTGAGSPPAFEALPGGGKVLQVVQDTKLDRSEISVSSAGTFVDISGLSVAITPSATSSKIIILVSQAGDFVNGDNNGTNRVSYMALFRGSSEICGQKQSCQYQFAGYNVPISFSFSVMGGRTEPFFLKNIKNKKKYQKSM